MWAHTLGEVTHRGRLVIEGCGNPSHVWNVVEKIGENNWKVTKTSWATSQTLALGLEHDKIQAWWASSIILEKILKMVWWCRCFKMKSWSQTICYSKGRIHVHAKDNKISYVALKCYYKRLSTRVKASRRKRHWSTINLTILIKVTRA
jgi:hypothetical protein